MDWFCQIGWWFISWRSGGEASITQSSRVLNKQEIPKISCWIDAIRRFDQVWENYSFWGRPYYIQNKIYKIYKTYKILGLYFVCVLYNSWENIGWNRTFLKIKILPKKPPILPPRTWIGLFLKTNLHAFLRLFDLYWKKKQLCRRKIFNSSLFSLRKLNLKIQFFYNKNGRSFFFPLFFLTLSNEKIKREEKERPKKGLNWKKFFYKVVSFF
jgi:hypothetical protein